MIRTTLLLASLALPGAAQACGGFFCNTAAPVEQAGEDVFFYVDAATGTVTMHVQVEYEGPSEDFAWIVPVPGFPVLEVSSPELFSLLAGQVSPQFRLNERTHGTCREPRNSDEQWFGTGFPMDSLADSQSSDWGGVGVVASGEVGPYETVTLLADSSTALLDWLGAHGYDIPIALDPVLQPYVAGGQYFVALKLQKDKDTGDLTPLALTYPGYEASIPVQLTSVAATPDMPLRVTIAGPARAVPESYLHLEINPFAIDWWTGGSNYEEVVRRAAVEAGAHGFVTDYSGVPGEIPGLFSSRWDTSALALSENSVAFIERLQSDGYPPNQTLLDILDEWVQLPPDLEGERQAVYNCPSCYEYALIGLPFDAAGAADDVEALIVAPRRTLSAVFASGTRVTRLTSSLSPDDMTVDPVFAFNAEMPEVPRVRTATITTECNSRTLRQDADRRLSIGDFPDLLLPGESFLAAAGLTELEYIRSLWHPANEHIAKTTDAGDPDIVQDNHPEIAANIEAFNEDHKGDRQNAGCGCATPGPAGAGWAVLPLVLAAIRRRSRHSG